MQLGGEIKNFGGWIVKVLLDYTPCYIPCYMDVNHFVILVWVWDFPYVYKSNLVKFKIKKLILDIFWILKKRLCFNN
jgi:hypothetical protein